MENAFFFLLKVNRLIKIKMNDIVDNFSNIDRMYHLYVWLESILFDHCTKGPPDILSTMITSQI